jgi:light-regulated signal transduction histidine kinase (bacteriophytochrome)
MGRLIDELFAFGQVGRTPLSMQQVELSQLVRAVQRELQPAMHNRRIRRCCLLFLAEEGHQGVSSGEVRLRF